MIAERVTIKLNEEQMRFAIAVGVERGLENVMNGVKPKYGCDPHDIWTPHINGAIAEYALAIAYEIPWGKGGYRLPDVGKWQVRHNKRSSPVLFLHPPIYDRPSDVFVLASGVPPKIHLNGWIVAKNGQIPENWKDPAGEDRWCYVVQKMDLHDMATLREN